jgi:hypothetical protein
MRARMDPKASEDQKTAARLKAEELYNKACQHGNGWVCWIMSDWYLREGAIAVFPKDPARAMSLVRRGCDLGYAASCATLAKHMIEGVHTKKDVPAAMDGAPPARVRRRPAGGMRDDREPVPGRKGRDQERGPGDRGVRARV